MSASSAAEQMGSRSVIDMTPPDKPHVAGTRPSTRATGRKTPRLVTPLACLPTNSWRDAHPWRRDRRRCCWYYLRFPDTGEHGAVYLSASEEVLREFGQSEVARTIPEVYPVQGSPVGETAEAIMLLRLSPDRVTASRQSSRRTISVSAAIAIRPLATNRSRRWPPHEAALDEGNPGRPP
jgi:hypothetical protein